MNDNEPTNPIDPRENADTATAASAEAAPLGAPEDREDEHSQTVDVPSHPVQDSVFRSDGEPYTAIGHSAAGPRVVTYSLTRCFSDGCWRVEVRIDNAPRNAAEDGTLPPPAIVAEANVFGPWRNALAMARAMCGGYAARLAAKSARNAARKARKAEAEAF